jgi:hypothetical protein
MPKPPVGAGAEATVLPQAGVMLGAGLLVGVQVVPVQEYHRQVLFS